MVSRVIELFLSQVKTFKVINLSCLLVIATHSLEIFLLLLSVEHFINNKILILVYLFISTILMGLLFFYSKIFSTNFSFQWNYEPYIADDKTKMFVREGKVKTFLTANESLINEEELTPREREVLEFITRGFTSREMAEKMFLSKKTIDHYRSSIKDKLGYKTRSELISMVSNIYENESTNSMRQSKNVVVK